MYRSIIQELATHIDAVFNCIESDNIEWEEKHRDIVKDLIEELPHGSGINYDYYIDWDKCKRDKVVFSNSYDAMNDVGMYDKVIDFVVTVTPTFNGINITIKGNFGKYQDIKDYLIELYYAFLTEPATIKQEAQ